MSCHPRNLFLKTASLAVILEFIFFPSARAACPNPLPAPNAEIFKSSAVIVGTVISEKADINPYDTALIEGWFYLLRIERTLRGARQRRMTVYTENTNGRFPLKVGGQYLLFVYREEGRLAINGCGNSALLSEAGNSIQAIEAIKHAGPYGEIEGHVQFGRGGDGGKGVRIVAHARRHRFSAITGEDRWFRMNVPPGKYQLTAFWPTFSIEYSDATLWYDDPDHFLVHRGSTSHVEYIASPK